MKKFFGALVAALLLSSPSGAVTVDLPPSGVLSGPTSVVAGQTYTYRFDVGPVKVQPNYTLYALRFNVNGEYDSIYGTQLPESISYTFNRVFDMTGIATLNVFAIVETYINATIDMTVLYPSIMKTDATRLTLVGVPSSILNISVVPIGGTLPLLLSALGVIGWAARRRGAAAAMAT